MNPLYSLVISITSKLILLLSGQELIDSTVQYGYVKLSDSVLSIKVDSILSLMTLEEKIGQMNLYNGFWDATGPPPKEGDAKEKYDDLRNGLLGGVINVYGVKNVRQIQKIAVKETRLKIPLLFGQDVIHGEKTIFPIPLAEAATWNMELVEKSARIAAIEASAMGINWTFSPMLDVSRDARWGRVMEGGGEDPYLASQIAVARVNGFQGKDLALKNTIAACVKHFAGYGFVESGKEYNSVDVGMYTLYNVILPPFKAAKDAGVSSFMGAFHTLNGVPATADSFLLKDILKNRWKFEGFVVSDWASIGEMENHGFSESLQHASEQAVLAGTDMDMESYAYINHLEKLVEENKVDTNVINDAVKRILAVKFKLGLFDNPYLYCNSGREKTKVKTKKHLEASLEVARESIVLLKNENNILPLSPYQKGILLIGDLADDKNSPLGNWRASADKNSAVSILEGLKKKNKSITYVQGPIHIMNDPDFLHEAEINKNSKIGIKECVGAADKASVVIIVLGENGFESGEGRSKAHIGLSEPQSVLLEAVYAVNKNIILVLNNGRPLTIPFAQTHIPSIIEAWHLGSRAGDAVAEVIFGETNPSGKLPMTFPADVGQIPIYYNSLSTGRRNPSEMVVWSHYSDETNQPAFPFGYGLSYSKFTYSNLVVDKTNLDSIVVSVEVKNIGTFAGKEVAQLYIQDVVASLARPIKELKGFKKFFLDTGEMKTISFIITPQDLGFYNNKGEFVVEDGKFNVMVGTNSQEGLSSSFYWKKNIKTQ